MNTSRTIKEYLDELSSSSPTPGGGNVSALCGTLASCLGIMVCNLTIGKKKYLSVENEISDIRNKLDEFKDKFIELAVKDNTAFDKVMEAFKLPKETEDEKVKRQKSIEEATLEAAKIPSEVIKMNNSILPLIKTIAEKGNRNSVSDAGVAALLVNTASQGAYLNVLINCSSLKGIQEAQNILQDAVSTKEKIKFESNLIIDNIAKELIL